MRQRMVRVNFRFTLRSGVLLAEKKNTEDAVKEDEEKCNDADQEPPQSAKATNDIANNDESIVPDPVQSTA